jgi:DnaJ-class molecular chaperone
MNDSYTILGLRPGADRSAIISAYRALAKQHHPDRSGGNAERFHQIRRAYDTLLERPFAKLVDKEVQRQRFYHVLSKRSKPKPVVQKPQKLTLQITLADLVKGAVRRITLDDGRALDIRIPAGQNPEQKLRIVSKTMDLEPQEIHIQLQVKPESGFTLQDRNILHSLCLPLSTLRQGGKVPLNTPAGRLQVRIPILSQKGARLRIPGKGLPANGSNPAGDMVLTLRAEPAIGLSAAIASFASAFAKDSNLARHP